MELVDLMVILVDPQAHEDLAEAVGELNLVLLVVAMVDLVNLNTDS